METITTNKKWTKSKTMKSPKTNNGKESQIPQFMFYN